MIGSLIAQLAEIGWDAISPSDWVDRGGEHWRHEEGHHDGDPSDIVDAIHRDVQESL